MPFNKEMQAALLADQAKLEAETGEQHPLFFLHEPNYGCDGCCGGDKWPASESYWRCPVCDTEYFDPDEATQ